MIPPPVVGLPVELVVVGGGDHARIVIEAARSRPGVWTVVGFVDPAHCPATDGLGVKWLGGDEEAALLVRARPTVRLALGVAGVGVSSAREAIVSRYAADAVSWATVVHERAWVSPSARLAPGVFVGCGAAVNAGVSIEEHVIVNTGAIVEHDVVLGAFCQVGPGVALGGAARVGAGAYLGLGCRVRDHVSVGRRATVGMGAVVIGPVEDGETVLGVPARPRTRVR